MPDWRTLSSKTLREWNGRHHRQFLPTTVGLRRLLRLQRERQSSATLPSTIRISKRHRKQISTPWKRSQSPAKFCARVMECSEQLNPFSIWTIYSLSWTACANNRSHHLRTQQDIVFLVSSHTRVSITVSPPMTSDNSTMTSQDVFHCLLLPLINILSFWRGISQSESKSDLRHPRRVLQWSRWKGYDPNQPTHKRVKGWQSSWIRRWSSK